MTQQIVGSIRKHLIVFALCLLCFVAIAYGINYFVAPTYEAKASLVANFGDAEESNDNKYNDILANQMLTQTYEEVIQSQSIARLVKDKLDSPLTTKQLLDKTEVRTDPGTLIVSIYSRDGSPRTAVAIANAFAESFVGNAATIVNQSNVTILDLAVYENSLEPVSPKKMFNLAIGGFIGLAAGTGFSLLLERKTLSKSKRKAYKVTVPA